MTAPSFRGPSPAATSLPTSHPPSFPSFPRTTHAATTILHPSSVTLPSISVPPVSAHSHLPHVSLPAPSSLAPPLHEQHSQPQHLHHPPNHSQHLHHQVHRPLIPPHFPTLDLQQPSIVPALLPQPPSHPPHLSHPSHQPFAEPSPHHSESLVQPTHLPQPQSEHFYQPMHNHHQSHHPTPQHPSQPPIHPPPTHPPPTHPPLPPCPPDDHPHRETNLLSISNPHPPSQNHSTPPHNSFYPPPNREPPPTTDPFATSTAAFSTTTPAFAPATAGFSVASGAFASTNHTFSSAHALAPPNPPGPTATEPFPSTAPITTSAPLPTVTAQFPTTTTPLPASTTILPPVTSTVLSPSAPLLSASNPHTAPPFVNPVATSTAPTITTAGLQTTSAAHPPASAAATASNGAQGPSVEVRTVMNKEPTATSTGRPKPDKPSNADKSDKPDKSDISDKSDGEQSAANPKKRPHRSISHAEKRRLCELKAQHPEARHNYIAKLFQAETGHRIERSTVTRVLQRTEFWLKAGTTDSTRKRRASPRFPLVEEALCELIRNRALTTNLRAELHDKKLMKYSREIAHAMAENHGGTEEKSPNYTPNLNVFRGSLSWIQSFKKRNALVPDDEDEDMEDNPGRPGVSVISPREAFDMWQTELNISETKTRLGEFTRLEDVYLLEATELSTTALPEHVSETSIAAPSVSSHDDDHASDDALGLMSTLHNDRSSGPVDLAGPAFPVINFTLPPLSSSLQAPNQSSINSNNQESHNGFSQSQLDPFSCGPANVDSITREEPPAPRHALDDDATVIVLLSGNGIGDRPRPWLVGKQPLKTVGKREGDVWHDVGIRYFHNARGWLTSRIVRKWLEEFDKSLDRKVAVLTSLITRCDMQLMKLQYVTLIPLPRTSRQSHSSTGQLWRSKSSPLYHGIEETFRVKYRCQVLEKAIQTVCRCAEMKPIPLKAAAEMISEAWSKVPTPLIRRAWRDLAYMPARLHRSCGQPRVSHRNVSERIHELTKMIRTYQNALAQYPPSANRDVGSSEAPAVRPSDVQAAFDDPKKYVWFSGESSVLHPTGTVADFVKSVCSLGKDKHFDKESLDAGLAGSKFPIPPITCYEEALLVANKLAEFMRSDEKLSTQHSLYLVGGLQLEFKRLEDQRRDAEHTNAWQVAGVQNTD